MRDRCPNCGGSLHGDGVTSILVCEFAESEDYFDLAPDEGPVFCRSVVETGVGTQQARLAQNNKKGV